MRAISGKLKESNVLLQDTVDLDEVRKVFPYGQTDFEVDAPIS